MPKYLIINSDQGSGKGIYSNSSPHGFRLDGTRWPTVDHYLLAQRFPGTPLAEAIRLAPTVAEATRLYREAQEPKRPDWADVKQTLMDKAILAKFKAHPRLQAGLLATGNRPLIEKPPPLEFISRNTLGCALMRVRSTLRRSEAQKNRKPKAPPNSSSSNSPS